jgi:hypothetical protein
MDRWMRVLLFGVGVAMLMLAAGRLRSLEEASMADTLTLGGVRKRLAGALGARFRATARTLTEEQTLALRAADRAGLPRQRLAELRAMYVRPLDR